MRLINRASTGTALKAMQCIVTMTNGLKGRESADALGIQVVKCETRIVRGMLPIQTIRLRKPNRHRKGLGMERTKETLEARVRETPLADRLKECQQRIGNMCAELRGPKMSIPVEYYDDDFYICTTLADAQATVEALQAHQQLHDRIFERQKCLLAHYVTTIREAVRRLRNSTHSAEQPEPYESRTPVIAAFLEEALGVNAEEVEKESTNLKQQVEALQRVRDEFERERDQLHAALMEAKAALDAEREKVKGLHEITKVICTHCCEPMEIPSKAVLQTQLSQLQALVRAKEDAYEKILLSRERLEREMRGYPPVDNEGIPMVWQEPVGWVKRHPGRHDASNY